MYDEIRYDQANKGGSVENSRSNQKMGETSTQNKDKPAEGEIIFDNGSMDAKWTYPSDNKVILGGREVVFNSNIPILRIDFRTDKVQRDPKLDTDLLWEFFVDIHELFQVTQANDQVNDETILFVVTNARMFNFLSRFGVNTTEKGMLLLKNRDPMSKIMAYSSFGKMKEVLKSEEVGRYKLLLERRRNKLIK